MRIEIKLNCHTVGIAEVTNITAEEIAEYNRQVELQKWPSGKLGVGDVRLIDVEHLKKSMPDVHSYKVVYFDMFSGKQEIRHFEHHTDLAEDQDQASKQVMALTLAAIMNG